METMKRTATCGELTKSDSGKKVILNGWVHRNRDHGGIHFINLRDRYGITQIVIDEDARASLKELAAQLKFEYCIAVEGTVRPRPDSMVNPDMPTGEIEVKAENIVVLSRSDVLPFMIDGDNIPRDDLRFTYRYLDLRAARMQRNIMIRHTASQVARRFLTEKGFLEIETPTLIKSTPEGARDFLVPSRTNPGKFFALPQSPQLLKQIIMVSGFDKYFQIARCYRDEDARGDRQLEFTQIDLEMSFVSREDIFAVTEGMMSSIFKETINTDITTPFRRITYVDAMNTYGTDKPDLRFSLELADFSAFVDTADFKVFKTIKQSGGAIKAIVVPDCASFSRKDISELEEVAKTYGAKGLAWMKVTDDGLDGGISKFYTDQAGKITDSLSAKSGDLILIVGDSWHTSCTALGAVRNALGKKLDLVKTGEFIFSWIVDFPMFEWNTEENKWDPAHHLFSMPKEEFIDTMEDDPAKVKGDVYDLACNGVELASGSIRVHDPEIQARIFDIVGFSREEAEKRFGFLLKAFKFGAPPHGGIAPGLDRLVTLLTNEPNIREVIPFPKNTLGQSPMDESPGTVEAAVLKELHLDLIEEKTPENATEDPS